MKTNKRIMIASVSAAIAVLIAAYALFFHPSCAKRNTYVPELNGCVLQRVACNGLLCSPQEDQNLSCGEHANACGTDIVCTCTDADTTDWK